MNKVLIYYTIDDTRDRKTNIQPYEHTDIDIYLPFDMKKLTNNEQQWYISIWDKYIDIYTKTDIL